MLLDIIKWDVEVETGLKFPTRGCNSDINIFTGTPAILHYANKVNIHDLAKQNSV